MVITETKMGGGNRTFLNNTAMSDHEINDDFIGQDDYSKLQTSFFGGPSNVT